MTLEATASSAKPVNVMFHCHDTYGLGHLRRTLTLAAHLRTSWPGSSQLIVTGSPVAGGFPFPSGTDYVKLPSVVKVGPGAYEARSISSPIDRVLAMRRDILLSAARNFRPDVLIVDHAPAGLKREVVTTLRWLKEHSPSTRLVVGLRDIVDEAPRVRREWAREGVYPLLDDVYDRILVYGQPDVYDIVANYGLSPRATAKTRYVGYLRRQAGYRSPEEIRSELGLTSGKLVIITAGGGGDGRQLFQSALTALRRRPDPIGFDCLLVGGPLISEAERAELHALATGVAGVRVLDFAEDMASYLGAADGVVSMGGFNTVCELLSFARPTVIVPRVTPRQEQLIRARALADRGLVRLLHPDDLTPSRLLEAIDRLLVDPPRPRAMLTMDGLDGVTRELADLFDRQAAMGRYYDPPSLAIQNRDVHAFD